MLKCILMLGLSVGAFEYLNYDNNGNCWYVYDNNVLISWDVFYYRICFCSNKLYLCELY